MFVDPNPPWRVYIFPAVFNYRHRGVPCSRLLQRIFFSSTSSYVRVDVLFFSPTHFDEYKKRFTRYDMISEKPNRYYFYYFGFPPGIRNILKNLTDVCVHSKCIYSRPNRNRPRKRQPQIRATHKDDSGRFLTCVLVPSRPRDVHVRVFGVSSSESIIYVSFFRVRSIPAKRFPKSNRPSPRARTK